MPMREHSKEVRENLTKIVRSARHAEAQLSAREIASLLAEGCEDAKAAEVTALDVTTVSDIANYFIVASGRSDRQTQGIANRAIEMAEQKGLMPVSVEGFDRGHWILVDFGDVVLHVFYEPMREHYNLESLWARAKRIDLKRRRSSSRRARTALHAA